MADRLPVELAIRVIKHAAFDFRFTDRRSVVHLASTSHAIYDIVAPIMYHTMIIPSRNRGRVRSFMFDGRNRAAAVRVCSHVRVLYCPSTEEYGINPTLLTSLECIIAVCTLIHDIFERIDMSQHSLLRQITVFSPDFAKDVTKLPARARSRITRVCGFLCVHGGIEWNQIQDSPVVWICRILDALPNVTHFGLVLVNLRVSFHAIPLVDSFKVEALQNVVQTALRYRDRRLQRVVLRVCSPFIERRRGEIEKTLQEIKDPRFSVWWDDRAMSSWDGWKYYEREDVKDGRDIWTAAKGFP